MKQSICYLYEYEGNKQIRNLGFLKYIQEESKIKFQIHAKNLNCNKNQQMEMYVFASREETCFISRAGYVQAQQGKINYMVTVEDISEEEFLKYDGIYLQVSDEKKYVAMWNQKEVDFTEVRSFRDDKPKDDKACDEVSSCDETCECREDERQEENGACEENIHFEEDRLDECFCEDEQEEITMGPCDADFLEEKSDHNISYEKIERQDIAKLPQREWKLANNSFLLHGYHNYQHILFIQESGRSFIGVPGIYANREADAAKNFGFPIFHRVDNRDMKWESGEREYGVDFGYWCKEVSYQQRRV